jgi:hypothetical protein
MASLAFVLMTDSIQVQDDLSLRNVAAILHDARFERDGILFERDAKTFALRGTVLRSEPGIEPRWDAFELRFDKVLDCMKEFSEAVRYYEIATIRSIRPDVIAIVGHYAFEIQVHCLGIEVRLLILA